MIINKVKEKLSEGKNIKRETIIDLVNDYDALNYGINSMRQDYLPLVSERDALKAENERILGVSEIQRGFFNAAMDRAEKAEKELDTWKDLTEQRGEELAVALKQLEICGNELDTTREQLLCVQDDYLDMRDTLKRVTSEKDALKLENARMKETLDDYYDAVKRVLDEECPEDEKHCSCVPVLREEIRRIRIALEVIGNVPSAYLTACEKRMKTIAKEALH